VIENGIKYVGENANIHGFEVGIPTQMIKELQQLHGEAINEVLALFIAGELKNQICEILKSVN
jgi:hypothetical protein